jgi:hypothetical protein
LRSSEFRISKRAPGLAVANRSRRSAASRPSAVSRAGLANPAARAEAAQSAASHGPARSAVDGNADKLLDRFRFTC